MKNRLGVIQFPGSNCEYETARAADYSGFETEIIRWNCDEKKFRSFDGYILPGGFSFQDRVRAGVISAKLAVMEYLEQAVEEGMPVLGICNGCQILAETGLITDTGGKHEIEVSLAHNTKDNKPFGFLCDWVYVKVKNPAKSAFTRYFEEEDVLPVPVNHAEGKFVLASDIKEEVSDLTAFTYCSATGEKGVFPVNPNGTVMDIAGICNKKGNVLGIMPHPERAVLLKQIPYWIQSEWAELKYDEFRKGVDVHGPWQKLFLSLHDYISEMKS
ncbi:MAG: phosphoribosylformylglycinamidine synthase I [bacterium]|nr:phosphoribosylformylglycinamidine synthase I [bacterium]